MGCPISAPENLHLPLKTAWASRCSVHLYGYLAEDYLLQVGYH